MTASQGSFCQHCQAWRGSLGNEPTPFCPDAMQGQDCADQCYLGHLLQMADALFRVLRDDGTLWWNHGDSYANDTKWGGHTGGKHVTALHGNNGGLGREKRSTGLKPKDLMNIPARFSIAMQGRGWTLRSEFSWLKKNAMPSSQEDRPSVSHEHVFLFSKRATYFWDAEAIRHANSSQTHDWTARACAPVTDKWSHVGNGHTGKRAAPHVNGRTRRTGDWWYESLDQVITDTEAWLAHAKDVRVHGGLLLSPEGDPLGLNVNPQPFSGAHFAVFSPKLVEPMIRASTSEHGACGACGNPWGRVVERVSPPDFGRGQQAWSHGSGLGTPQRHNQGGLHPVAPTTLAWAPTCQCGGYRIRTTTSRRLSRHPWYRQHWQQRIEAKWPALQPCVVLDPFGGSGTSALVSRALGHQCILIELSQEYCQLTVKRLRQQVLPFADAQEPVSHSQEATQAEMTF